MSIIQSIILAIIEGLTEFLPISSTGHMVLTSSILGIENDKFTKLFEICIQLGAILAVVALYWKKFFDFSKWQFYVKLMLAVVPALIFGKLFDDLIDEHLGNPAFIATVLLLGGIILLFVDNWFKNQFLTKRRILLISLPSKSGLISVWRLCSQDLVVVLPLLLVGCNKN
jgi:undecaprenyl-diphosphatase